MLHSPCRWQVRGCSFSAAWYLKTAKVTEFSITNQNTGDAFLKQFYQYQLSAFSASAGSFFWSWNVKASSNPVVALAAPQQAVNSLSKSFCEAYIFEQLYSFVDILARGDIVVPPSSPNMTTDAFLASLGNPCNVSLLCPSLILLRIC
jgi:hypothetical protein